MSHSTRRKFENVCGRLGVSLSDETKEYLKRINFDDDVDMHQVSEETYEALGLRYYQEFKGGETDRNFIARIINGM